MRLCQEILLGLGGPGAGLVMRHRRATFERACTLIELADRRLRVGALSPEPMERRRAAKHARTALAWVRAYLDGDGLEEYRRVSAFNRLMGIDVHEISPAQVKELFPLANVEDVLAGFYVKEDGRADPVGRPARAGRSVPGVREPSRGSRGGWSRP